MSKISMLLVVAAVALTACGGGGGGEAPVPGPEAVTFSVGGQLAGLGAGKSVTLAHVDPGGAAVQSAALNTNGSYSLRLPSGTAYHLRVLVQPVGQTCAVSNAAGTASADVNNIGVVCADDVAAPEAKVIAGTVAGLGPGKALVLQLTANGTTQEATVNADGSFQFPQAITGTYAITVKSPPAGQACTVANGQGSAAEPPAVSVALTCANTSQAFKLGGSVSGNLGVVALRNAGSGETTTVVGNGSFAFTQPVLQGSSYTVTVVDKSHGQSCSVANGAGTASADVNNVAVACAADVVIVTPPAPVLPPSVPTGLTMTYGIKSFNLAWGTVTAPVGGGTVSYRLLEDADGAGPAASTQVGGTLAASTYTQVVSGLLHTRLNAQYSVQACNSAGCSTATAAISPNLTQAIGYFKASNTGAADFFGRSVALSGDGSTLAVGAHLEDSAATGTHVVTPSDGAGAADSGAVYVYTRTGGTWTQQAYVKASNTEVEDLFGWSVALSGDGNTLAVGAIQEDGAVTGINGNQANNSATNAGAVYVYTRTGVTWAQQAYVKASNTGASDNFGRSVALSGDGSTLAVGAYQEDGAATGTHVVTPGDGAGAVNAGAVYVYTRTGVTWAQQAYVKASNTGGGDQFGNAVALSGDGGTLAVGATGEASNATGLDGDQANNSAIDAGAVYVYTRTGVTWAQQAYVKASNTGAGDQFGNAVALSGDGSTLAVGAYGEASNAGAVYVYTRTGVAWAQQAYVKASNTGAGDVFGWSVALSGDGSTLAVGAFGEESNATGLNGDQINNSMNNAGAVYVYTRTGVTWAQQAYLKASNTQASDSFGLAVALSGDGSTLAAGAWGEASNATGLNGDQANNSAGLSGAVYLY